MFKKVYFAASFEYLLIFRPFPSHQNLLQANFGPNTYL